MRRLRHLVLRHLKIQTPSSPTSQDSDTQCSDIRRLRHPVLRHLKTQTPSSPTSQDSDTQCSDIRRLRPSAPKSRLRHPVIRHLKTQTPSVCSDIPRLRHPVFRHHGAPASRDWKFAGCLTTRMWQSQDVGLQGCGSHMMADYRDVRAT